MSLIESLKEYYSDKINSEKSTFNNIWDILKSGDEAKATIHEVLKEELVNRLVVTISAIDGQEYEITISKARKWV